MALRKDGNARGSASYMPYNASNSFIKKMTGRVTGLIGWGSQSQSTVSQNHDELSSSTDEDNVSPTPKRMRVQTEREDTLHNFIPNASKAINEACSPIQPVNDINAAGPSNRNKCMVSSTPANTYPLTFKNVSTSVKVGSKLQSHNLDVTDNSDRDESSNYSMTVPQYDAHQRHNATVPAISKDMPSQLSNFDSSKLSGSFSANNSRRPSFNVDVFSTSSKQLSSSVCENRNLTSLSPFYAARTMYGGASALLPYGNQTFSRMRSASTSKLNLFSPRSQITIQPVPSPSKSSDQETMSAAARRILDTLEKYCSPVIDAKRIPVNESSKKADVSDTSTLGASRGVKRKLPALSQMMPSTTDLLRIKRKEKMQDSISSARQIVSSVPERCFTIDDNDSSSDSADLDYSVLKENPKNVSNSQKYIGRIRRKDEKKIDDRPLTPIELPNVVLKISSLPKLDITDTFTFSKPLLLENLDQSATEKTADDISKEDRSSPVAVKSASTSSLDTSLSESSSGQIGNQVPKPGFLSFNFGSNLQSQPVKPNTPSNKPVEASPPKKTAPWTCKVCHLESTSQSCSSCSSTRETNIKPVEPPKPIQKEVKVAPSDPLSSSSETLTSPAAAADKPTVVNTPQQSTNDLWKSLKKAASSTWKCEECWVQNQLSDTSCVSCGTAKKSCTAEKTQSSSTLPMTVNDGTEKSSAAASVSQEKEDVKSGESTLFKSWSSTASVAKSGTTPSVSNEKEDVKSAEPTLLKSSSSAASVTTATNVKPEFTFGFKSTTTSSSTDASSGDNTPKPVPPPSASSLFTFGNPAAKPGPTIAPPFRFGALNQPNQAEAVASNTFGGKSSADTAAPDSGKDSTPKFGILKTVTTPKENGEETVTNNAFNDIGASSNESSLKKKNVSYPIVNTSSTPNLFGSNGPIKSEASSPPSLNANTPAVTSSNNLFATSLSQPIASKPLVNNVQAPLFSATASKVETMTTAPETKNTNLFSNSTSSFGGLSSQSSGGIFGGFASADGFASKKADAQPVAGSNNVFHPTSTFPFGSNPSTAAPAVTTSSTANTLTQLQPGGFLFNGPKAEGNASPKFVFGGSNANSSSSSSSSSIFGNATTSLAPFSFSTQPASIPPANEQQQRPANTLTQMPSGGFLFNGPKAEANGPPKFVFGGSNANSSSSAFGDAGTLQTPFTFSTPPASIPSANEQQQRPPVNSLFTPAVVKSQPDLQQTNNSTTVFGSNPFAGTQQQQPTASEIKKSGGFNFPATNQFNAPTMNSFSSFAPPSADSQDQNRLNTASAPGSSPFVFGQNAAAQQHNFNLTVPTQFNFTAGNAVTTFSAQPTANTGANTVLSRRIKKAVRRSAK